jgi:carboxylate-amine ligase
MSEPQMSSVLLGRADPDSLAASWRRHFARQPFQTIGLEEELILVDLDSLLPVDEIESVLEGINGDTRFSAEFRAAQIEIVTPVCVAVADLHRELSSARRCLIEATGNHVGLLAAGTHPTSTRPIPVTLRPRFLRIALDHPWATRRGLPSGLHVHVGIDDAEEALAIFNAARSFLPELAALAANSPFFEGRATGLASTRLKLVEDFPRSGIPPSFTSWEEFGRFLVWGARCRAFDGINSLWWDLRPRPDLATLEFRIADAQTRLEDTAAIAAVCQSLVSWLRARLRAGETLQSHPVHILNENRWRALRDGVDGELADIETAAPEPTSDRIAHLLSALEPHANALGCSDELADAWRLLADHGGAGRQRKLATERGLDELAEWLVEETERPSPQRFRSRSIPERETGQRLPSAAKLRSTSPSQLAVQR